MCHPRFQHRIFASCGCGPFFRQFMSMDEERRILEEYKEQLEKELAGLKERIQELKSRQS